MAILHDIFQPITGEFAPQLILISAGFDAHQNDPLANMELTSKGYGLMTAAIMEVAAECCTGKIVLVLEGGYSLSALAEGISNVLQALLGEQPEPSNIPLYLVFAGFGRIVLLFMSLTLPFWM